MHGRQVIGGVIDRAVTRALRSIGPFGLRLAARRALPEGPLLGKRPDFAKPGTCAFLPLNRLGPLGVPDRNYPMTAVSPSTTFVLSAASRRAIDTKGGLRTFAAAAHRPRCFVIAAIQTQPRIFLGMATMKCSDIHKALTWGDPRAHHLVPCYQVTNGVFVGGEHRLRTPQQALSAGRQVIRPYVTMGKQSNNFRRANLRTSVPWICKAVCPRQR